MHGFDTTPFFIFQGRVGVPSITMQQFLDEEVFEQSTQRERGIFMLRSTILVYVAPFLRLHV